jgi:hypothetical protein
VIIKGIERATGRRKKLNKEKKQLSPIGFNL